MNIPKQIDDVYTKVLKSSRSLCFSGELGYICFMQQLTHIGCNDTTVAKLLKCSTLESKYLKPEERTSVQGRKGTECIPQTDSFCKPEENALEEVSVWFVMPGLPFTHPVFDIPTTPSQFAVVIRQQRVMLIHFLLTL